MTITKRNHYNPCFWTAYWNIDYYKSKKSQTDCSLKPREQIVFALNLRTNKILKPKVDNIFFEKNAYIVDIKKEEVLDFCKRNYPEKYNSISEYFDKEPDDSLIDFENHFTLYENLYKDALENTIRLGKIPDIGTKTFISFFLLIQLIRNHNTLGQTINLYKHFGQAKFEVLFDIRNKMSNPQELLKSIIPFLSSQWTIYKTNTFKFALSDNPLLIRPYHIMIALSPDLMLEIDLKKTVSPESACIHKTRLGLFKYFEFKRRTIENSSREIIFTNENLLINWQKSKLYRKHLININNAR